MPIIAKPFVAHSKGTCSPFHPLVEERSFKKKQQLLSLQPIDNNPRPRLRIAGCYLLSLTRRPVQVCTLKTKIKRRSGFPFAIRKEHNYECYLKVPHKTENPGTFLANSVRKLSFLSKTAALINSRILQRPRTITGISNR